jgi:ATP-dependent DNA helicase
MLGRTYSPYMYNDLESLPPPIQAKARADRLTFLLDKSTVYARIIGDRMERQQIEKAKADKRAAVRKENKEKKAGVGAVRESNRKKDKHIEQQQQEEDKPAVAKRKRRAEADKETKKQKFEEAKVSVVTCAIWILSRVSVPVSRCRAARHDVV